MLEMTAPMTGKVLNDGHGTVHEMSMREFRVNLPFIFPFGSHFCGNRTYLLMMIRLE